MRLRQFLWLLVASSTLLGAAPHRITAVDRETGRGVPMVRMTTTHRVTFVTDSAGVIAFDELSLLGRDVTLMVEGEGYVLSGTGFVTNHVTLPLAAGGSSVLRLQRVNIAERLYRVTGAGIYEDSVRLGDRPPIRHPLLNGGIVGQDTVVVAPYRGRLYWFWGDSFSPDGAAANFAVAGATSELPDRGGLDPEVGVDLDYFEGPEGFARKMLPLDFSVPVWLEGLVTVPDDRGRIRLAARYGVMESLDRAREWGLAVFDDEEGLFRSVAKFDLHHPHRSAHPQLARVGERTYAYLFPNLRVPADLSAMTRLAAYEAYTPLEQGSHMDLVTARFERDDSGALVWGWKPATDPIHPEQWKRLEAGGIVAAEESWINLTDVETGGPADIGAGSVAWNPYRKKWILVAGLNGQVWFAEADSPVGPWGYARRIAEHDRYEFYNVTHHPFFDRDGGRRIFFEGTYCNTFSGNPVKRPRYDYNQVMYGVDLDDSRLRLPIPVYEIPGPRGSAWITDVPAGARPQSGSVKAPFFALAAQNAIAGTEAVYSTRDPNGRTRLRPASRHEHSSADLPVFSVVARSGSQTSGGVLAGLWRATADDLEFFLDLKQADDGTLSDANARSTEGNSVAGRLRNGELELTVTWAGDAYRLHGRLERARISGTWEAADGTESGAWSAVRIGGADGPESSAALVPLFEFRHRVSGVWRYSTRDVLESSDWVRQPDPLGWAWPNPSRQLHLDPADPVTALD